MPEAIASLLKWDGPLREQQVIQGAAEGKTDRQIARDLGISPETVATYWRRIRLRHGGSSRTEIIARLCLHVSDPNETAAKQMEADMLRGLLDHMEPIFAENNHREVLAANSSLLAWLELDFDRNWVGRESAEIVEALCSKIGGPSAEAILNWPTAAGQDWAAPLSSSLTYASVSRRLIRWPGGDVSQMIRLSSAPPAPSAIVMMTEGAAAAA